MSVKISNCSDIVVRQNIYIYIDVVLPAIRPHNVLIVMIMLAYALCIERVARIAACKVYLYSRDTDLLQIFR